MQKNKIVAFLLALIVSIGLWFYAVTVVNPDDTASISGISVQFEGTDALTSQGLMLTGGENTKVSMKVSGRRSDLKELNNETVSAVADVTRIAASGSYQLSWSIVLPNSVATGDISEISRTPSRISVMVSEIRENPEVPIELEYTGEPKEGFMLDKATAALNVQNLTVRGPADEISRIDHAVVRVDVQDASALIDGEYGYVLLDQDGHEIQLSKYATVSSETVRVTIPVLRYKDIKLRVDIVEGGGATKQNVKYQISPPTIRVTGSQKDLEEMPEELSVKTIYLAEMGYTQTLTVKPALPGGVTNRAEEESVKITLELVGLTTKAFTIPTSDIEQKNAMAGMTFGEQSVKIILRGRTAALYAIKPEDIHVIADMEKNYDPATKTVTLDIELPASTTVGVISGPYVIQVIQGTAGETGTG